MRNRDTIVSSISSKKIRESFVKGSRPVSPHTCTQVCRHAGCSRNTSTDGRVTFSLTISHAKPRNGILSCRPDAVMRWRQRRHNTNSTVRPWSLNFQSELARGISEPSGIPSWHSSQGRGGPVRSDTACFRDLNNRVYPWLSNVSFCCGHSIRCARAAGASIAWPSAASFVMRRHGVFSGGLPSVASFWLSAERLLAACAGAT